MTDMEPTPFLTHIVRVSDVPRSGLKVRLEADEASRERMMKAFDLVGLPRMTATFNITGNARRLKVKGEVRADIRQNCVVTLEDFDSRITEPFDLTFSEDVSPDTVVMQNEDDGFSRREDPEPLINDRIDLGEIAAEHLALALDPWPRKPGVTFSWIEDEGEPSPFAALRGMGVKKNGDAD